MQNRESTTRRKFTVLACGCLAGLAGCIGPGDETDDPTPTETEDNTSTTPSETDDGTPTETDDGTPENTDTDESEPGAEQAQSVVQEMYALAESIDGEEDIEQYISDLEEICHSASPIPEFYRSFYEEDYGSTRILAYETVDTEATASNLGTEEMLDQFVMADDLSDNELTTVAEENIAVEATTSGPTIAVDTADEPREVEEGEDTTTWLTAPEDDEWRIVF